MASTEFFDSQDIEKLMEISKNVVSHDIDQVYMTASIMAVMLSSEKNKQRQRDTITEVFNEKFDNEKFRWSQDSKMIDWGQYVVLPSWIKSRIRPFPVAWWQLSVSIALIAILYVVVLDYIKLT